MAKKAKKVSWRTLARRAEKAAGSNLPKARRLRAEAGKLRSAARKKAKKAAPDSRRNIDGATRAATGWATRRSNDLARAIKMQNAGEGQAVTRAPQDPISRGVPGHGEVVGGVYAELAERIAMLARKKDGMNAIYADLSTLALSAHCEGCVETDKAATKRLVEVREIMDSRIVCGFLSAIEHTMNYHRGLPPEMVHVLDSYTITKIVDALNKAGYHPSGNRNIAGPAKGYDKESL